jgi:FAD-dependent oxidoreductase family protein
MTTLTLTRGPRLAGVIDTDILVFGAGPAGLATAITAARHGARVLVVERRPGAPGQSGTPSAVPAGPHRAPARGAAAGPGRADRVRRAADRPATRRGRLDPGQRGRTPGPGPVRGGCRRPAQHRAFAARHRRGAPRHAQRPRLGRLPPGCRSAAWTPAACAEHDRREPRGRGHTAARGRRPVDLLAAVAGGRARAARGPAARVLGPADPLGDRPGQPAAGDAHGDLVHHDGGGSHGVPARGRLPGRRRRAPDDPGRRPRDEHRYP